MLSTKGVAISLFSGAGGLDLFFGSLVVDWQVDDGEWVFLL